MKHTHTHTHVHTCTRTLAKHTLNTHKTHTKHTSIQNIDEGERPGPTKRPETPGGPWRLLEAPGAPPGGPPGAPPGGSWRPLLEPLLEAPPGGSWGPSWRPLELLLGPLEPLLEALLEPLLEAPPGGSWSPSWDPSWRPSWRPLLEPLLELLLEAPPGGSWRPLLEAPGAPGGSCNQRQHKEGNCTLLTDLKRSHSQTLALYIFSRAPGSRALQRVDVSRKKRKRK